MFRCTADVLRLWILDIYTLSPDNHEVMSAGTVWEPAPMVHMLSNYRVIYMCVCVCVYIENIYI